MAAVVALRAHHRPTIDRLTVSFCLTSLDRNRVRQTILLV